jgi:hypothetical protein
MPSETSMESSLNWKDPAVSLNPVRAAFKVFFAVVFLMGILTWWSCASAGTNSLVAPPTQVSALFPAVTVSDLEGRAYALPQEFRAEKTLLLLAFTGNQQAEVDTWLTAFQRLASEATSNAIPFKIDFIEMPTIETSSAPFRAFVNNGMRSGIREAAARQRTWTLFTNRDMFLKHLGISSKASVYALVVSRSGEISFFENGPATDVKVLALGEALKN